MNDVFERVKALPSVPPFSQAGLRNWFPPCEQIADSLFDSIVAESFMRIGEGLEKPGNVARLFEQVYQEYLSQD